MQTEEINLKQPDLYINRELSLLEFNRRVLYQALDESKPLLERVRYLCIASTNMDEFFEVRVAGVKQQAESGSVHADRDNIIPADLFKIIIEVAREIVDEQYRILNNVLFPALEEQQIRFIRRTEWGANQSNWLRKYFESEVLPILSPMGLDPAHPFPRVLNKSLNFIVSLSGKDAFGRDSGLAVINAPRSLPRLIQLPANLAGNGPHDFVFLSSIIHAHVESLFPGMKVLGSYQFRVTRNSDLYVDDEAVNDLLRAVEGELASRRYGDTVRLEVPDNCPENVIDYLLNLFQLTREELYQVNGPVNLSRLVSVIDMLDRPDLTFTAFTPGLPKELRQSKDIFATIRKGDILLHHPFHSFLPVVDFLKKAATDPKVLSIKQTLYRTGQDSAIVEALLQAARNGKEVTVVVELRARFDEEANIGLATRLQEAGAHVVYGVVGFKTHAKMIHILRRENKKLRHYVHLGTGNYHSRTARLYTDYGLLTSDDEIGDDVHRIFMQLTSLGKIIKLNKLLQSPFTLHKGLISKIERETQLARAGKDGRIIFKMNSLVEPTMIESLYQASRAGVNITLVVRGMCCLKPKVEGVSDNIEVRSIIGRFLEHTRVYYFANDGSPEVYCSSADLMHRNLFRRVETCFPIVNKKIQQRLMGDLEYYINDNAQAWCLDDTGVYHRVQPKEGEVPLSAQQKFLEQLALDS